MEMLKTRYKSGSKINIKNLEEAWREMDEENPLRMFDLVWVFFASPFGRLYRYARVSFSLSLCGRNVRTEENSHIILLNAKKGKGMNQLRFFPQPCGTHSVYFTIFIEESTHHFETVCELGTIRCMCSLHLCLQVSSSSRWVERNQFKWA